MNEEIQGVQILEDKLAPRTFPTEGTNLARILSDSQYRQSFHKQLKRLNPFVVALYRIGLLPMFGVSRTVMLLSTKGKKSGKTRTTPIGYFRIGGDIHLFSAWGKRTSWYTNMTSNPSDIYIQIGMQKRAVQAITLDEPANIRQTLKQFVSETPSQAHYLFGWNPESDRMEDADFSAVINQVLIVKFVNKHSQG